MSEIGTRLKKIRKVLKLTQVQFSASLDVSQSNYSQYEKNTIAPNYLLIAKIVKAYNINPNWILTGDGEMFQTDIANQELEQLKKEIQTLKKTIDTLEKEYDDLQAHNKELDSELTKRRLELLDCQQLLIKLQQRNA